MPNLTPRTLPTPGDPATNGVWGAAINGAITDLNSAVNALPGSASRATISVSAPPIASVGTVGVVPSSAGIPGQMLAYNTSYAVNDSMTQRADIARGVWTLRAWYGQQVNGGIINIDYSLDEGATWVSAAAALDQYLATSTTTYVDKTGIVVAAPSTIRVRWTVTGKNASSSATLYLVGQVDLVRTS